MLRALEDFAQDAAGADVALIYFAGHGMEVGGVNLLMPVDVSAGSRQDLIAGEAGQQEWGERLAGVLAGLLAREDVAHDLRRQHHYGSHTD